MKKNTAYTIGAVIVLLICAFCFVALPAFTGSASKNTLPAFGKYNGKEIKYEPGSDFYNIAAQNAQMYEYYNIQITSSIHRQILRSAFETTALKMAYDDYVKSTGYVVPKSAITRKLIEDYYSDADGNYSSKLYKETSDDDKLAIRTATEESLYTARFYDDFFGSETDVVGSSALYGLKESDAELDFLQSYNSVKRGFDMALFKMSDFPDEEKVKFAKANSAYFINYDISVITTESKSTAETVLKRLNNNEITFEDAVAEYSEKTFTNTEGKFNGKYQYQVEVLFEDKADLAKITDLAVGVPSEIIKTVYGYSIIKHNSVKSQADFTDESVLFDVNSYINNYERNLIEDYFIAKANDLAVKTAGNDFSETCAQNGAEYVQIAPFPLNYGSANISESVNTGLSGLSGADTNENFLTTAFSLSLNEISSPMVMNDSVAIIKYTEQETAGESDSTPFAISSLEGYDTDSINNAILADDKFEDNFSSVYASYMN